MTQERDPDVPWPSRVDRLHDTHTVESRFKHGALLGHLRSCACGLISGGEGIVNRQSSVVWSRAGLVETES